MELSSLFTQKALQGSLGLNVENLTAWLSAGAVNPCLKPLALWPSYHGILEWPGSEGTLNNLVPTPCHGQRRLPLDQVAPSPVWLYWTYHFYCLSPSSFMITSTKFHWWDNSSLYIPRAAEPGSLILSREFGYSTCSQQLSPLYRSCISVTVRYSCMWNKSLCTY